MQVNVHIVYCLLHALGDRTFFPPAGQNIKEWITVHRFNQADIVAMIGVGASITVMDQVVGPHPVVQA